MFPCSQAAKAAAEDAAKAADEADAATHEVKQEKVKKTAQSHKNRTPLQSTRLGSPPAVAVCTMVRNSCSQLFSWVAFHHQLGVSNFTIYDVDTQDCSREVLEDFVAAGIVEMVAWPGDGVQRMSSPAFSNASVCVRPWGFDNKGDLRYTSMVSANRNCPNQKYKGHPGAYKEMLKLCDGQVALTNVGRFDLRGTPYNWEFCQTTAMADCVVHHRERAILLGFFDVDEYSARPLEAHSPHAIGHLLAWRFAR